MSQSATGDGTAKTERAILAGGCFWGMEDLLRRAKGVVSTRVGYTGGEMPDPTYVRHYGHAEAVEITFDPSVLSYRSLLELFFQIHDPTTYEQQGSDVGPSYRSAIFYTTDVQKDVALATIAEIEASGRWPGPVVSEINPEEPFWEAGAGAPEIPGAPPRGLQQPHRAPDLAPGWIGSMSKSEMRLLVREKQGRKRHASLRSAQLQ